MVTVLGVPQWVEQGPAPVVDTNGLLLGTGAAVDVAVHPEQPEVIYVATAGGVLCELRSNRACGRPV
jgi:hypothetical protein